MQDETIKNYKIDYEQESASLDKYLQEIGREDLITVEEEVELAQRIKKGDHAALEELTRDRKSVV